MNLLDIVVALVLGVFAFKGFQQGFTKIIVNLLTFFGGIVLALKYFSVLQSYLLIWIHINPLYLAIISFVAVWAIVFFLAYLLQMMLDSVMHIPLIKPLDRIAGAAAGAIKGALILPIFLIPVLFISPSVLKGALVLKPVEWVLHIIMEQVTSKSDLNVLHKEKSIEHAQKTKKTKHKRFSKIQKISEDAIPEHLR
ncbi:MAG: CvpA family protein [Candidatus Margulisbacteria bacterium]|nr:CvpA family protein [Candidatus Margulisiibacteriota bacterium]